MSITPQDITGLILAGSRDDLGLQDCEMLPRVLQTLMRLSPQVGVLRIHAARNVASYAALGVPVWTDQDNLSGAVLSDACKGLVVGLSRCTTPYLLTVWGDLPRFPLDVVLRLSKLLSDQKLDIVLSADPPSPGVSRVVPGFCLMRTSLLNSLQTHCQTNSGSLDEWLRRQRCGCLAGVLERRYEHASLTGLSRQEQPVIA